MTPTLALAILAFAGVMFLFGVLLAAAFFALLHNLDSENSKKARPVPNNMIELLEHALATNAGSAHELLAAQLHANELQRALDAMEDSQAEILAVLDYLRNAKHDGVNLMAYMDRVRQRELEKAVTKPLKPKTIKGNV